MKEKLVILAFLAMFLVACTTAPNSTGNTPNLSTTPTTLGEASPGPEKVVFMKVGNFYFDPATIEVNKGDKVRLVITTIDGEHGIGIPEFNINEQLPSGSTKEVTFVANKVGTFEFRCNVPCGSGHREMIGTIVVKQ